MTGRPRAILGCAILAVWLASGAVNAQAPVETPATSGRAPLSSYTLFEAGAVRPLALSTDGTRLFAANIPDGRLEVLDVSADRLVHRSSVPVGLEPVAVAVRSTPRGDEVWVVNHLSDSVSIIDAGREPPVVTQTLLVGDEPRDIVFAGEGHSRAFVTTAHRGQNSPVDPALTTPSTGRADVWVFDANAVGSGLGGTPLAVVTLFGDTPRALAATPDGRKVYAAVFLSGNQTTTVGVSEQAETVAGPVFDRPPRPENRLPKPEPDANTDGVEAPETGIIVRFNGRDWVDQEGTPYTAKVPFELPDYDVFEIDAVATPPREVGRFSGVGTTIFNMLVHPRTGTLYVTNLEALNDVRFEGPGTISTSVRGHLVDDRITVIKDGEVLPRRLNKHVDYGIAQGDSLPPGEKAKSLSQPLMMVSSPDGGTLYVAAFGSGGVGVFSTEKIEDDSFTPSADAIIALPGGGPCGLALNADGNRLFALTRFDNAVHAIDTESRVVIASTALYSPEPAHVFEGRPIHYDARFASANGTASCASCHIFGDNDGLAWDLGNPDGSVVPNPNDFRQASATDDPVFHPMKGPMTTQTFRGIADSGPMHWRGDRTGRSPAAIPGESLEMSAFKEFNEAFVTLLGRERELEPETMHAFTRFALSITHPPNPIRRLDNGLDEEQAEGERLFLRDPQVGFCFDCHVTNVEERQFGTAGESSVEFPVITQEFKIPSLRNVYQKVGAFGGGELTPTGPQIRGFGFMHDGSRGTIQNFLTSATGQFGTAEQRRLLEKFVFVFPTNLAPIVGQQVTLLPGDGVDADVLERIALFVARASLGGSAAECDLVVRAVTVAPGEPGDQERRETRGWVFVGEGRFQSDRRTEDPIDEEELRQLAAASGSLLTYMCVPPGAGVRIGIDRDEDGVLDGDERDAGTDPADASDPGRPGISFVRSDCTGDGASDISDAIKVLNFLFLGGARPECDAACDINADGSFDVSDAIFQLDHLFVTGAPIPAPFPQCGVEEEGLDCQAYPLCGNAP